MDTSNDTYFFLSHQQVVTHPKTMTSHAPTSRAAVTIPGDEEASAKLALGEFQQVPCLSLSETRLLINTIMNQRRSTPQGNVHETETLTKTQDYLDSFSRFKGQGTVEQLSQLLGNVTELESFERSQLGSLCCESAEEAKTLIPSLTHKISDADLESLLKEITSLRQFTD